MNGNSPRTAARELASAYIHRGDPLGWFDVLYRDAGGEASAIPWADLRPNPNLSDWLSRAALSPHGHGNGRALVIGCGLGDDAELLASLGWSVVAFDISAEAIRWAGERFPDSKVSYRVVDLFDAPPEWRHAFVLVVEAYTLQVLPADLHELRMQAVRLIGGWVAAGGLLCVIARGRDDSDTPGQMPWPLTESEVRAFAEVEGGDLNCEVFEDYMDPMETSVRRFRAIFRSGADH